MFTYADKIRWMTQIRTKKKTNQQYFTILFFVYDCTVLLGFIFIVVVVTFIMEIEFN